MLATIVRLMGTIWLYGASLVILLSYGWIWYEHGFSALRDMLSPFNFTNFIAVGAALLSIAGVAAMVMLALIGNSETRKTNGDDRIREYRASSIRVEGNSATMYQHKNYLMTMISGPVGSSGIPEVIQLGDVVMVEGNTIQVQHIIVKEILADMKYGNEIFGKKGDIHCTIVQSLDNLPYVDEQKSRDRLWINVRNCVPLKMAPFPQ